MNPLRRAAWLSAFAFYGCAFTQSNEAVVARNLRLFPNETLDILCRGDTHRPSRPLGGSLQHRIRHAGPGGKPSRADGARPATCLGHRVWDANGRALIRRAQSSTLDVQQQRPEPLGPWGLLLYPDPVEPEWRDRKSTRLNSSHLG